MCRGDCSGGSKGAASRGEFGCYLGGWWLSMCSREAEEPFHALDARKFLDAFFLLRPKFQTGS